MSQNSVLISGIHHVTAIAGDPQRNLDFYVGLLGLRLVKLTVNFDDPGTYHFYFGNKEATVGSTLTFFPWPGARQGSPGVGQSTRVSFSIGRNSVESWIRLLENAGLEITQSTRFGETVIGFQDPDGLGIELLTNSKIESGDRVIETIQSVDLNVIRVEETAEILTNYLGFELTDREDERVRYESNSGSHVDILGESNSTRGRSGAGTIHHVAFRTPSDEAQIEIRNRLLQNGFSVSPVMERKYFRSIYFREPGGILFELATDLPGMGVDEPMEALGTSLKLPDEFEKHRKVIESALPKLVMPK